MHMRPRGCICVPWVSTGLLYKPRVVVEGRAPQSVDLKPVLTQESFLYKPREIEEGGAPQSVNLKPVLTQEGFLY